MLCVYILFLLLSLSLSISYFFSLFLAFLQASHIKRARDLKTLKQQKICVEQKSNYIYIYIVQHTVSSKAENNKVKKLKLSITITTNANK